MKETRSTLGFSFHRSIYVSSLFVQKKTLTPNICGEVNLFCTIYYLRIYQDLLKVKLVFFR